MSYKFAITSTLEQLLAIDIDISKNGYRLLLWLKTINPYSDTFKELPSAEELAETLRCSVSTIYRQIKKIIQSGLIIFRRGGYGAIMAGYQQGKKVIDPDVNKIFLRSQPCETFSIDAKQLSLPLNDLHKCENESPELPPADPSDVLQTKKTYTDQPDGGELDKKNNQEVTKVEGDEEKLNKEKKGLVQKAVSDEQRSESVVQSNSEKVTATKDIPPKGNLDISGQSQITSNSGTKPITKNQDCPDMSCFFVPNELLEKMRSLSIKITEQVINRIKEHHVSQAYSAVAHVENTWETINDPTKVFLYQLPKQPIEKMGERHDPQIIENIKAENARIEEEMKDPAYWDKRKSIFDELKQKLRRSSQKNKPLKGLGFGK